jgi:hypothetical protein
MNCCEYCPRVHIHNPSFYSIEAEQSLLFCSDEQKLCWLKIEKGSLPCFTNVYFSFITLAHFAFVCTRFETIDINELYVLFSWQICSLFCGWYVGGAGNPPISRVKWVGSKSCLCLRWVEQLDRIMRMFHPLNSLVVTRNRLLIIINKIGSFLHQKNLKF